MTYTARKANPKAIDRLRKPTRALNGSRARLYERFTDATVNTCWNTVDRHVLAGRGAQAAIIHDKHEILITHHEL